LQRRFADNESLFILNILNGGTNDPIARDNKKAHNVSMMTEE
jgi:hypothetical protein